MSDAGPKQRQRKAVATMTKAAAAFLQSLQPEQQVAAHASFDAEDRRSWTYLPGPRPGVALRDLDSHQRELAMVLLDSGLSAQGAESARAVMALEAVLRGLEEQQGSSGSDRRHPQHYWFRVLGEPGSREPWVWKVGGHHLNVHMTIVGDRVAGAPQFFGANPATVPSGHHHAGLRTLPQEEDLARDFLATLTPTQRDIAVTSVAAPGDIQTRRDPVVDRNTVSHGLYARDLRADQRDRLTKLIRLYLDRVIPEIADVAWQDIADAGIDNVSFQWAGSTEVKPGHGHYYAVLGPTFLLEYDNVQNTANHIHTVWRDLRNDWGEDLLAAHYAEHPHQ